MLKKQLWIWPIIAVVLLAVLGYSLRVAIEQTMQESLQSELQTLLGVERSMLEVWLKVQGANAESLANNQNVRRLVSEMVEAAQAPADAAAADVAAPADVKAPATMDLSSLQAQLARELSPGMSAHRFVSFIVIDKQLQVLAASNAILVGRDETEHESLVNRVLDGETVVSPPFASVTPIKDSRGQLRTGVPTMFVCAPIRDANLQVVAVLGLRIRPEREFNQIVQLGRVGETGETYAINKDGLLLSSSRFDDELILLGLVPDIDGAESILTVSARDPGGNLTAGFRPKVRRGELPLTRAATAAIEGSEGFDVAGYNDYRGVPVVGAWQWLPKYDMGLVTEIDYAEAYRPLTILRQAFFTLFVLLALCSIAIFLFTIKVARLRREAQKAEIEAKQLGQYRLEEKIGAGAMGVVYRGHHAMLRRPTAIKLLDVEKVNETSLARFEREVQITCKLNHPNTVAIYDYGRTPEGVFYYAMEFLDGINLQHLVEQFGPQPEGRVIRILKQICGSLYEAHSLGLVHRDIKPANVMLNRRGGESDVVKVLDFGLVKALGEAKDSDQPGGLSGTPLYMSPEAIQMPDSVDARSDLYAVGAIGYFLITGQPVFTAHSLVDLCQQHIAATPMAPAERLGRSISPELESALLACLDKNRARRPQTARDLSNLLDRAPTAGSWLLDDADAWWGREERSRAGQSSRTMMAGHADRSVLATSDASAATTPGSSLTQAGFDQTMALDRPDLPPE